MKSSLSALLLAAAAVMAADLKPLDSRTPIDIDVNAKVDLDTHRRSPLDIDVNANVDLGSTTSPNHGLDRNLIARSDAPTDANFDWGNWGGNAGNPGNWGGDPENWGGDWSSSSGWGPTSTTSDSAIIGVPTSWTSANDNRAGTLAAPSPLTTAAPFAASTTTWASESVIVTSGPEGVSTVTVPGGQVTATVLHTEFTTPGATATGNMTATGTNGGLVAAPSSTSDVPFVGAAVGVRACLSIVGAVALAVALIV